MKILLTGSTGYIGKRLLPVLIELGYEVICCVRDLKRFNPPESLKKNIRGGRFSLHKDIASIQY